MKQEVTRTCELCVAILGQVLRLV